MGSSVNLSLLWGQDVWLIADPKSPEKELKPKRIRKAFPKTFQLISSNYRGRPIRPRFRQDGTVLFSESALTILPREVRPRMYDQVGIEAKKPKPTIFD